MITCLDRGRKKNTKRSKDILNIFGTSYVVQLSSRLQGGMMKCITDQKSIAKSPISCHGNK